MQKIFSFPRNGSVHHTATTTNVLFLMVFHGSFGIWSPELDFFFTSRDNVDFFLSSQWWNLNENCCLWQSIIVWIIDEFCRWINARNIPFTTINYRQQHMHQHSYYSRCEWSLPSMNELCSQSRPKSFGIDEIYMVLQNITQSYSWS